jgi:ABC-2 type transport system permease protein
VSGPPVALPGAAGTEAEVGAESAGGTLRVAATRFRAVLAFTNKDFKVARSYRLAFFTGLFGAFWGLVGLRVISKLVHGGMFSGPSTAYFNFVVIGVLLVFILEPTAAAGSAAVRQDQVQGTLEYLATLPVPRVLLGLCWCSYAALQAFIFACFICGITFLLGFRVSHVDVPVVFATLVLTIIVFLAIGIAGTALVLALQQGTTIVVAVTALLTFLSGTLYPVSELPQWVQPLVHLSPLTYSLEALRAALLSNQVPTSYAQDLLVLLGFAVVLLPLSAILLEMAFRFAQRRGSLSTF